MTESREEHRQEAFRRVVDGYDIYKDDVAEIASEIEVLEQRRAMKDDYLEQRRAEGAAFEELKGEAMDQTAPISRQDAYESDPFADLSQEELDELELSPEDVDFPALSVDQQKRYWSLLSPGEKLRLVRCHLDESLEQMALEAQLPLRVIKALEYDRFSQLPGAVEIKAYYRAYAEVLGIDAQPLIDHFENITGRSSAQAQENSKKGLKQWGYDQLRVPFIGGALLLTGFILGWFVMAYGGFNPVLEDQPQGGVIYSTP